MLDSYSALVYNTPKYMYEELMALLAQHDEIGVMAHFRPDGDAIGATVALGLALTAMGKKVRMYNEDPVPPSYAFIPGSECIELIPEQSPETMSLLICLDCGAWKRLGDRAIEVFAHGREEGSGLTLVNFDHHASNERYGQLNIVNPAAAATSYMLLELIDAMGVPMDASIATALYVGISTDTGSFQYGSTTPAVMRAAACLLEAGVDVQDVNRRLYQEVPLSTLMVNREVLNHMVVEEEGLLSHYSLDAVTKNRLAISSDDSKDLVEIIRVISGVKASIIFEDLEDGRIRMSLRSKDSRLNVGKLAESFGGGGHHMAAGIRMKGSLENCRDRVLAGLKAEVRRVFLESTANQ